MFAIMFILFKFNFHSFQAGILFKVDCCLMTCIQKYLNLAFRMSYLKAWLRISIHHSKDPFDHH